MKVAEAMTRGVCTVKADDKLQNAAKIMAEEDVGFLPVEDGDQLVGSITDRDIVIRCVANGKDIAKARVRDAMTKDVKYCYEDEELEHVMTNMGDIQLRRLPVMNRQKRLIGVVAIADAALKDAGCATTALSGVCSPGGLHTSL